MDNVFYDQQTKEFSFATFLSAVKCEKNNQEILNDIKQFCQLIMKLNQSHCLVPITILENVAQNHKEQPKSFQKLFDDLKKISLDTTEADLDLSKINRYEKNYTPEEKEDIGDAYHQLSQILKQKCLSQFNGQAEECYQEVLQTYTSQKNLFKIGNIQRKIGIIKFDLGPARANEISEYLVKSIENLSEGQFTQKLYQQIASIDAVNEFKPTIKEMIADTIDCIGMLHYYSQKYNYSLEQFKMSLKAREQLDTDAKNQDQKLSLTLFNCGLNHMQLHEYNESQRHFERALETILPILDKNHIKLAIIYENIGQSNYRNAKKAKIKYLSQAVNIWKTLCIEERPYLFSYLRSSLKQKKEMEK